MWQDHANGKLAFGEIRLQGKKKDSYAIRRYQSDLFPKGTLKVRVKNYQTILNVYSAQKLYGIFFLKPLLCFPQNTKRQELGLEDLRTRFFKAACSHGRSMLGVWDSLFSAFPLLRSRPVSSGGSLPPASSLPGKLCPHVCTELTPSCFSDFSWNVISLEVPLTCTSEVITDHHELFFLFHNTYCNLQWSRIPLAEL